MRVTLREDTELHSAGTVVDALVYSGSTSNPNFHFMPRGCRFDKQEIETDTETATVTTSHCATADIIAAAVGPSGSNSDYLFNLNGYLHENGIPDGYIHELSAAVALRMGPWRERPYVRYLKHTAKRQSSAKDLCSLPAKINSQSPLPLPSPLPVPLSPPSPPAAALALAASTPPPPPCLLTTTSSRRISYTEFEGKKIYHLKTFLDSEYLIGWGSNEHLQLGVRTLMTHPNLFLQSASSPVHLNIEKKYSKTLSESSTKWLNPSTIVPNLLQPSSDAENITKTQYKNDVNVEISFCQVLCGGASSAFLGPFGDLIIWGKVLQSEKKNENTVTSSITANLNTENHKSEVNGKQDSSALEFLLERQDSRLIFKDIVGAALGHDHILLLTKKGWVVPIGDNYWGQCQGPKSFCPQGIFNFISFSSFGNGCSSSCSSSGGTRSSSQDMRIQQSSLDNSNNESYSYSDNNGNDDRNSIDLQQQHLLDEEPEVQILKLACGVRHSAAITKHGDLYVWGSGSAACIMLPTHPNTISNENTCTSNKESVKEELEQLQSEPFQSPTWRPDDAKLIDVSCGMELTVTIDDKGRVWSLGSNKHGSLGRTIPANLDENENVSFQMDENPINVVQVQVDSLSQKIEKLKTRKRIEKDGTPRLVEGLESGVRWQRVSNVYLSFTMRLSFAFNGI